MSIMKNDIPILEYDTNPIAVIMPNHEHMEIRLPKKAVFVFLGSFVDTYAKEHHATVVAHFISATKEYPVYILDVDGQQICLMQAPVGAAAAAQILVRLVNCLWCFRDHQWRLLWSIGGYGGKFVSGFLQGSQR